MVVKAGNMIFRPPRPGGEMVTEQKKSMPVSGSKNVRQDETLFLMEIIEGKEEPYAKALNFDAMIHHCGVHAVESKRQVNVHMDGIDRAFTIIASYNNEGRRILHS